MLTVRHIQRAARSVATRVQVELSNDRGERGSAMTEYGLLLVFVVFAGFAILMLFGGQVVDMFTDAQTEFSDARNTPEDP